MTRTLRPTAAAIALGAVAIAVLFVLWPAQTIPPGARPVAPPEQPLPTAQEESRIFVNVQIAAETIGRKLEEAAPRSESGSRSNPVGNPVVDDELRWNVARSAIALNCRPGRIEASTTLDGGATIKGSVRVIRGDVGKLLGKFNPTNVPFSVSPRFRGKATIEARPQVTSSWRVNPALSLNLDLDKAEVPIKHFGSISIRDLVRDDLDKAVRKLQHDLERSIGADPFLEDAARRAQASLCEPRTIQLGDQKSVLSIVPVAWEASQPQIDEASLRIGLGLRAEVALSLAEEGISLRPCPPLAQLQIVDKIPPAEFALNVPASVSWEGLSNLANDLVREKQLASCESQQIELEIRSIKLEALGDRILALVGIRGRSCSFIATRYEGEVQIIAKPSVIADRKELRLSEVEVAFDSRQNLLIAGLFGSIAEGLIKTSLNELTIDLEREFRDQLEHANLAFDELKSELKKSKINGEGEIRSIELRNVIVRPGELRLFFAAKGDFSLTL